MSQSVAFKPPVPPAALSRRERRSARPGRSQNVVGAWMVAPAFVLLVTFVIVPIALTFTLAFTNARLVSPQPIEFIGFDNFTRLFQSETFWKSLRNTFIFALFVVPIQ